MLKPILLIISAFIFFSSAAQTAGTPSIEVITQEKIQGVITILAYSPGGNLIASGSEKENAIKVWDFYSGKIIGKLDGHEGATTALAFNKDGTKLISAAKDNRVIVWDLNNWLLEDSTSLEHTVQTFVYNPKKDLFYGGDTEGNVLEWKINDVQNPNTLYQHQSAIRDLDFREGKLVSGALNGTCILYDTESNQKKQDKRIHIGGLKAVDLSLNGQEIISVGTTGKIHVWNAETMEEVRHFNASGIAISAYDANIEHGLIVTVSSSSAIQVWNLEGTLLQEFKSKTVAHEDKQPVEAIKISPDGSSLASSGMIQSFVGRTKEEQNVIRIWDLKRGTLYKTLQGKVNPIHTFDFHPINNQLVTLGDNQVVTFWDFNLAEKMGDLQLEEPNRELAAFRNPVSVGNDGIDRGDIQKGKRFGRLLKDVANGDLSGVKEATKEKGKDVGAGLLKRQFKEKSIVKYSSKGNYLITKIEKDEIRLYAFEGDKPNYVSPLFSYQLSINALLTSPDEKYLAVLGAGDSAVSIVNLETKKFVTKLPTHAPQKNFRFVYEANSLAFSPDGNLLAVCFNTGKTFVYETRTWRPIFENILPDNLGYVESPFVNFTKDGQYMVVKSMTGIKKYDTEAFNIFATEPLKINGYSAPMDRPENYAITIQNNQLHFEDLLNGNVQKSIEINPHQVTHISINPQGLVGITTKSGQFKLIQPTDGKEQVLMVANGDNYIFKTTDNYYKVSKEGRDLVTFRIGNSAYPFEQFDAIFNRPDLVLKTLGCTDEDLMALYKKAYEKRIKKLGLKTSTSIALSDIPRSTINNAAEIPAITADKKLTLDLSFKDRSALTRFHIWINNVPVFGKNGKSLTGTSQSVEEEINLVYGINKIQVACQNKNGYESLIQTFYINLEGERPQRNLYLATIGTSDYKDDRYDLNYPVKDAKDLVALMSSNTNNMYANIYTKELYDEAVTKDNIAQLKGFLDQSKPNDVVIVFVAGHGVLDANFDYYFGTHDIDFTNPANRGLAYAELEKILDGISANKKILIMDTCHSGEVDKEDVFLAANDEEEDDEDIAFRSVGAAVKEDESKATPTRLAGELFNDLRRGTGATVISSAGGAEFAMESDQWKNGLFTYCLLNGLKNRTADLNQDGTIMLLELQEYVVDKVTALSHGRQEPNSRIQNIELDFPIW